MDKDLKERWIHALRSGQYKQGQIIEVNYVEGVDEAKEHFLDWAKSHALAVGNLT